MQVQTRPSRRSPQTEKKCFFLNFAPKLPKFLAFLGNFGAPSLTWVGVVSQNEAGLKFKCKRGQNWPKRQSTGGFLLAMENKTLPQVLLPLKNQQFFTNCDLMTVFFELFEKNQNILQMNGIRARNHVGFVKKFQREVGQINTRKRVKTDKSRCIDGL